MKCALSERVHWRSRIKGSRSQVQRSQWLADPLSLTSKLEMRGPDFHVRLLCQGTATSRADESKMLGMPQRMPVWERLVLLYCGEKAVVFARTVASRKAVFADWPYIRNLGQRPLGKALFADPRVVRDAFQFAELPSSCPDIMPIRCFLGEEKAESSLYARRSLFRRHRGTLLVTEFFLPSIMQFVE